MRLIDRFLKKFFDNLELNIFDVEKINTHGGSIRVFISQNKKIKVEKSVNKMLKEEEDFGLKKIETYIDFGKKIEGLKQKVKFNLKKLKQKYNKIVGFGSPAKATTSLNYFGISSEIDFIIEDNDLKDGMFVPGVNIPIKHKSKLNKNEIKKDDCILVFAWNFYDEIKKNNNYLSKTFINIKSLEK